MTVRRVRPRAPSPGRAVLAVLALSVLLAGAACGGGDAPGGRDGAVGLDPARVEPGAEPPGERPDGIAADAGVRATRIAHLGSTITSFGAANDGSELLVGDREGVVRRLERDESGPTVVPRLVEDPVLDLSEQVSTLGERGVFDLEVTPDGSGVVVNYAALDGAITVEHYTYRPGRPIDPTTARTLIRLPHPFAWHHGGGLAFDADGDLYIAIGDMEFRQLGVPGPQDPDLMLGGVMRVPAGAVDGSLAAWTPSPSDMVARGLRNPWRIAIDPATGDLWIGDVGLQDVEEIDRIPAEALDTTVTNFGWPYFEGTKRHQGEVPPGVEVVEPVHERRREEGVCGMVGGFVYHGTAIESLRGRFVHSDLCDPGVRSLRLEDGTAVDDRVEVTLDETVVGFGQGPGGELYGLGGAGSLYRFDPAWWDVPDVDTAPPDDAGPPPTVQSTGHCEGVSRALIPLEEFGDLGPAELEAAMGVAIDRLDEAIPELQGQPAEDARTIRASFLVISEELEAADWDPASERIRALRDDISANRGAFVGFGEAMARIVDSECG